MNSDGGARKCRYRAGQTTGTMGDGVVGARVVRCPGGDRGWREVVRRQGSGVGGDKAYGACVSLSGVAVAVLGQPLVNKGSEVPAVPP